LPGLRERVTAKCLRVRFELEIGYIGFIGGLDLPEKAEHSRRRRVWLRLLITGRGVSLYYKPSSQ